MIKTFVSNGLTLEYEVSGQGVPLVFLHGMGGSIDQIKSTYEAIEGIQLIVLNQQGHGKSEVNFETLDFYSLADDVIHLLDFLHIDSAYFAGISMGAAVCLNVAVRYPERVKKLCLIRNAWLDQPMGVVQTRAYQDLGECLINNTDFKATVGWKIVCEPSAYTRNAFLIPIEEKEPHPKKYLILPKKCPIENLDDVKNLKDVYIVACKGDLCHPFEYGQLLSYLILDSKFVEIPNKDVDPTKHKEMVNITVRDMIKGDKFIKVTYK